MTTLDGALSLWRRGLSVIPVPRADGRFDGKVPAIAWRDYQSRLPTEDEIRNWFATDQNIAVITGAVSDIVVVDPQFATEIRTFYGTVAVDAPDVSPANGRGESVKRGNGTTDGQQVVAVENGNVKLEGANRTIVVHAGTVKTFQRLDPAQVVITTDRGFRSASARRLRSTSPSWKRKNSSKISRRWAGERKAFSCADGVPSGGKCTSCNAARRSTSACRSRTAAGSGSAMSAGSCSSAWCTSARCTFAVRCPVVS